MHTRAHSMFQIGSRDQISTSVVSGTFLLEVVARLAGVATMTQLASLSALRTEPPGFHNARQYLGGCFQRPLRRAVFRDPKVWVVIRPA